MSIDCNANRSAMTATSNKVAVVKGKAHDIFVHLPGTSTNELLLAAWALTLSRSYDTPEVDFNVSEIPGCATTHFFNVGSCTRINDLTSQDSSRVQKSSPPSSKLPSSILCLNGTNARDSHQLILVSELASNGGSLIKICDDSSLKDVQCLALLHRLATAMRYFHDLPASALLSSVFLQNDFELNAVQSLNGSTPSTIERCVHHVISDQAQATPMALALCAWDMELTYAELDAMSTKLAHYLVNLGVQVEQLVALCFDKSAYAVISMLAVLKAGAAGFALGNTHPLDRKKAVMKQAACSIILTDVQNYSNVERLAGTVICVEQDAIVDRRQTCQVDNLPTVCPSNLAYVLFTSGSTGQPKGILIQHDSLCTSSGAHGERWNIGPGTRLFNFASWTFDVSVADIFTSLARGATICIPSETERMEDLAGAITKYQANWVFLTPTIAATLDASAVPTLKKLVLGGEPSTKCLLQKWSNQLDLIVCYGPAETTIYCSGAPSANANGDPMNIGYAIGCRMWITEQNNSNYLASVGTVGEIVIEGPILARGYLHEKKKAEKSFVNSFAFSPHGARIYKTGDLGKMNWDGSINILGRKDTQVKIRGQRVELGEIEHHLRRALPESLDMVVWASSEIINGHALVAFFTLDEKARSNNLAANKVLKLTYTNRMQQRVQSAKLAIENLLPPYMIPSLYVPLTGVPLTINGKTDRQALGSFVAEFSVEDLRQYSLTHTRDEVNFEGEPSTTEKIICGLVADILCIDVELINSTDNFYALGGNSLTAIQLASKARARNISLSVANIMKQPSIRHMARGIEENRVSDDAKHVQPFDPPKPFQVLQKVKDARSHIFHQCHVDETCVLDAFPCTPLQEGLFLQSLRASGTYFVSRSWNLPGYTDITKFKAAWNTIYQAFDILRTRIVEGFGGELWQTVIDDTLPWQDNTEPDLVAAIGKPLTRFGLARSDDSNGYHFSLSIHHSLIDGWSLGLLLDSVNAAYKGGFSVPRHQFRDYVLYLHGAQNQDSAAFWISQFEGYQTPNFPANSAREPSINKVTYTLELNDGRTSHYTLGDKITAAWTSVISSHAISNDIVIGVTTNGRNSDMVGIEDIIGLTLGLVPLRVRIPSSGTIGDLLDQVRRQRAATLIYENDDLREVSTLSDSARLACSFQNLLVVQLATKDQSDNALLPLINGSADFYMDDFSLVMECIIKPDCEVELVLDYDSHVVPPEVARRIVNEMASTVIRLQNEDYSAPLLEPIIVDDAIKSRLQQWNSAPPREVFSCVHELFAEQAQCSPSASAVDAWDGTFTYRELESASNHLATYLATKGIHEGDIVPVCFEKSRWYVVSILAVLKTGAAFVPLDHVQPLARLQDITIMVKATHCLVSSSTKDLFDDNTLPLIEVSKQAMTTWSDAEEHEADLSLNKASSAISCTPSSLAYVIFTSGSTGKPKGVMIEHRSFCSGALARAKHILRNEDSRVLSFSSHSFDTSIEDLLSTIIFGGCLCIPSDYERKNQLPQAIQRYRANTIDLTTSVAKALAPEDVPGLRILILGGEELTQEVVEKWSSHLSLINTYGPSECSIVCTVVPPATAESSGANIGQGVGCLCWVVSESNHDQLVSPGSVGELLIEGPIVARGYLSDQIKTAEVFLEDTAWRSVFPREEKWRMYKTGDLVRQELDGSLVYVGRKDSQVKIRGQRVEPREIETRLRELWSGPDVAIECIKIANGNMIIVAFLCNHDDTGTQVMSADSLQPPLSTTASELSKILPIYMLPSYYMLVDGLPLTVSGKLDRKSLQKWFKELLKNDVSDEKIHGTTKEQPSNVIGLALQSLWASVLNVPVASIGLQDTFFSRGGDSITAMQLANYSMKAGLPLTVAGIFEASTLERMVDLVAQRLQQGDQITTIGTSQTRNIPPKVRPFSLLAATTVEEVLQRFENEHGISKSEIQDLLPCSPLQESFIKGTLQEPGAYFATHLFRLGRGVSLEQMKQAWQAMTDRHDILRTRILNHDGFGLMQLVVHEQAKWHSAGSLQDCFRDARNITHAFGKPLSRLTLVRGKEVYIAWTAHHALFDGWSVEVMAQELQAIYASREETPPSDFRDFIQSVSCADKGEAGEFWKSQFLGFPGFDKLFGSPSGGYRRTEKTLRNTFDKTIVTGVNWTASSLLRAAWAYTLSQYSGSDDVVFGVVLSGRDLSLEGIESIVGPTMTTVPLRITIKKDMTLKEFVDSVHSRIARIIPFQQFGMQNIKQLSETCHEAANFETLLDIHAFEHDTKSSSTICLESSSVNGESFHLQPLVVTCSPSKSGLQIEFVFDEGLVSSDQAERMLFQFGHMIQQLSGAASNPSVVLHEIDPVSSFDKEQLFHWNHEEFSTVDQCIHNIVRRQAISSPDAMAIESWDGSFTYKSLDTLSTRIAVKLLHLGLDPKPIVPLCFEKSAWTIICMLAVLKAGGAYVALDSSHPPDRLRMMVERTRADLMLVEPVHEAKFLGLVRQVLVVDDRFLTEVRELGIDEPLPEASPSDAAMIVFTSGSTGVPKGVILRHEGMACLAEGMGKRMKLSQTSRVLQFAAYAFDVSNAEIFLTLMFGGCCVVPSDNDRLSALGDFIKRMEINWMYLTPTATSMVSESDLEGVEVLVLGGEAARQDLIDKFAHRVHLINSYGPAEGTIWPSASHFHPSSSPQDIGKGTFCHMWLVDPQNHNRLVPIGAIGEVLLDGPMVSGGYLYDQPKTEASFVSRPDWLPSRRDDKPRIFYKVGDLARLQSDGTLRFAGRKDTQVKLRGQRIELSEIEHRISSYGDEFRSVAVEVFRLEDQQQSLAAFIASNHPDMTYGENGFGEPSTWFRDKIRPLPEFLSRWLASYMVPSFYVPLRRLPTTVSGKLDRRNLRTKIETLDTASRSQYLQGSSRAKVEPKTTAENQMRSMWAQVLHLPEDQVSMNDSPKDLGADSMAAIKISALCRMAGWDVLVSHIMRANSIADLCVDLPVTEVVGAEPTPYTPFSLVSGAQGLKVRDEMELLCPTSKNCITDAYPCTPLQEGVFALSQQFVGSYVSQHTFELNKDIDLELFKKSWNGLVESCEILRTGVVVSERFGTLQTVFDRGCSWLTADDLGHYLNEDRSRPFGQGEILMRLCIIQTHSDNRSYFVWTTHHAIYDGWTMEKIQQHLQDRYRGESFDTIPPFRAFVQHVLSQKRDQCLEFWSERLRGFSSPDFTLVTGLKTGQSRRLVLKHSMGGFNPLSTGVSGAALIQGAWGILLGQYYNTQDVSFGMTLSGRSSPLVGILEICGPTISTIPVRITINAKESVQDFLGGIADRELFALPFEHFGLQNIQNIGIDARQACSFETLLVVSATKNSDHVEPELWRPFPGDQSTPDGDEDAGFHAYNFVLAANISNDQVEFEVAFDAGRISSEAAKRILIQLEHIITLLQQAEKERHLEDLDLITQEQHNQLRTLNCREEIPHGALQEECALRVNNYVTKHALTQPDRQAIYSSDVQLTFGYLNNITDHLAGYLQSLGIGPGSFVPIYFEKSPWAVVAMLSIVKAGAAYVPLDYRHPRSRIEDIIQEVNASHVIVSATTREAFAAGSVQIVELPYQIHSNVPAIPIKASAESSPDNALYVIYTSGSTGKPKGVEISHRAFCEGVHARSEAQRRNSSSRVLQFSNFAFDVSAEDILSTLMKGGTVCIPTEAQRMDSLPAFVAEANANTAQLTPSTLSTLNPDEFPSLKTVLTAGEAMTSENIRLWAHRVELINTYGPTEASVISIVTPQVLPNSNPASIGFGYGCATWIVDSQNHNSLIALGGVGELLLEGPILARHYLHDPAKTEAVFIENPKWATLQSRCKRRFYKTGKRCLNQPEEGFIIDLSNLGDLCKYDTDGSLLFLGRKDTQIKLRGHRIELEEIESRAREVITQHEIVVDVVQARQNGKKEIALFVVIPDHGKGYALNAAPSDDMRNTLNKIKTSVISHLERLLPEYMVPTLWVPIRQTPLSPSGKRNRNALQALANNRGSSIHRAKDDAERTVFKTETESQEILRKLWASVLLVDFASIGLEDNFIEIGGDSILAMKLSSAARRKSLTLTVSDIFKYPKLRSMAEATTGDRIIAAQTTLQSEAHEKLKNAQGISEISLRANIPPETIQSVLPATDFQAWAVSADQMSSQGWSDYLVISFSRPLSTDRLRDAFDSVSAHRSILRTAFVPYGAQLVQVVLSEPVIEHEHHECADWLQVKKGSESWITKGLQQGSGLHTGLLRLATFGKTADFTDRAILSLSHARFDALSLTHICHDLACAYKNQKLPSRPDFSQFVHHAMDDVRLLSAEHYWRELLHRSQMSEVVGRPGGLRYQYPVRKTHVRTIPFPRTGEYTFATTIKAAWALVLAAKTGSNDVVFGHLVSGRNLPFEDVDQLIGPCLNIVPIRVPIMDLKSHQELLQFVQSQYISSMPHETLGMSRLLEKCTNWPHWTRFSSIVQHQNVEEIDSMPFINDEVDADIQLHCPEHDSTDVWIISVPKQNEIDVTLSCNEELFDDDEAKGLLDNLVQVLQALQNLSEACAATLKTGIKSSPSRSLAAPDLEKAEANNISELNNTSQGIVASLQQIWASELLSKAPVEPSMVPTDVAFYDLRAGYESALMLIMAYRLKFPHLSLSVEDLIRLPTLADHARRIFL